MIKVYFHFELLFIIVYIQHEESRLELFISAYQDCMYTCISIIRRLLHLKTLYFGCLHGRLFKIHHKLFSHISNSIVLIRKAKLFPPYVLLSSIVFIIIPQTAFISVLFEFIIVKQYFNNISFLCILGGFLLNSQYNLRTSGSSNRLT